MSTIICHLTTVHPWNDIRIFQKECTSLAKYDFQVSLIAVGCENQVVNKVQVISACPKPASRIIRVSKTALDVYKKALEINASIYHLHDPELLWVGLLLKRKGKKVIYDAHEDLPRQIMSKPWIGKPLQLMASRISEKVENYIASGLTAIITATDHIHHRFIKINKTTEAIHNYPSLNELQNTTDWQHKKNEICYIGGITEVRGIIQMLEALEKCSNVKLHLAGTFSSENLHEKAKTEKTWRQVIEHGYVSRIKIAEILSLSKAGLVTLWPTPNHIHSQAIKMFEYMSAGIPVIASNFPLWKKIIEDNRCGICVDPLNPQEIADAINYVLTHDTAARQMGINGRKAVEEKYNWEMEEKKLIEFYKVISHF